MILKNNDLRPAFATAGIDHRESARKSYNDAVTFNTNSYSDTSSFGGFNEENTRTSAPRKQRPASQGGQASRKGGGIPSWIWLVAAAVVVIALIFALVFAVARNSSNNIEITDDTYIAFTEDGQTYRIATNGKLLDDVFESEPVITPSLDRSFAYIEVEGENGISLYLLRDKKLEEITMKGSAITDVIAYAGLKPGIVYEEDGKYCIYTEDIEDYIDKKDKGADNFLISDDASTVVYTRPSSNDANELRMNFYRNGTHEEPITVKGTTPIAISANGDYVYGKAPNSSQTERLYCISLKEGEKYPIVDNNFGGITAINVDGDEIMYFTANDTRFTTYVYNAKKDESYEIAKNYGIFTPASVDSKTVRYGTFKGVYVQSTPLPDVFQDADGEATGHTYFINKKYEAEPIAKALGKFSPDGDYFYYINANNVLYQVDLSDPDESAKKIYDDIIEFEITQKGNIYMLISDDSESGMLFFYKPSTGSKLSINRMTTDISMHKYSNKLYYTTEEDEVSVTEEGSKGESVKFDSIQLVNLPRFSDPLSKKTFAYYYDEETSLWSIFYTSNGNTFTRVTAECESILGYEFEN